MADVTIKKMAAVIHALLVSIVLVTLFESCEPTGVCSNPKCIESPILLKLKADLSDSSPTFHVGDTLRLSFKIPDTLNTNEGRFYLGSVDNLEFPISYYSSNSFGDSTKTPELPSIVVSKGTEVRNNRIFKLKDNRELELLFVLPKKTNYASSQ